MAGLIHSEHEEADLSGIESCLPEALDRLELSDGLKTALFLHIALLIIHRKDGIAVSETPDASRILRNNKKLLWSLKAGLKPLCSYYQTDLTDSDLAGIISLIKRI